ncbi:MAG: hypothetical protein SGPRY_006254 [Prymnesium sp.]
MYARWDQFTASSSESEEEGEGGEGGEDEQEGWGEAEAAGKAESERHQQLAHSDPRALSANELVAKMTAAELLGEEVLVDRKQVVELDRKRNQNREALAALRRDARPTAGQGGAAAAAAASSERRWVCMGDYFMKQSQAEVVQALQADQQRIEAEIESFNLRIKQKTSQLCEIDSSILVCIISLLSQTRRLFAVRQGPICRALSLGYVGFRPQSWMVCLEDLVLMGDDVHLKWC